jgi:hypothetical protein
MNNEHLFEALTICGQYHSTKLSLNHLRDGDSQVSNSIPLVIHECCASVINRLIEHKFTLSLGPEGLHVLDYCK